jgi:hypothetical protein
MYKNFIGTRKKRNLEIDSNNMALLEINHDDIKLMTPKP